VAVSFYILVEETGVPGEIHRPATNHWQTLSHKVVSSTSCHQRKEILKIYLIEQKICPNHQDEWYVYHSDLSRYVSDCIVHIYINNNMFLTSLADNENAIQWY
jgi:hypothetical protein